MGIKQGDRPKALIETLSEGLLETFRANAAIASLIDPYGVYQHLMDYWSETMQDDAWMIASDGWQGDWRNNTTKTRRVRNAIRHVLGIDMPANQGLKVQDGEVPIAPPLDLEHETDRILELVKNQNAY